MRIIKIILAIVAVVVIGNWALGLRGSDQAVLDSAYAEYHKEAMNKASKSSEL